MKKVVIVPAISSVTSKTNSHKAGPMYIYADQLQNLGYDVTLDFTGKGVDDLSDFDIIAIYHADNGTSRTKPEALNLFGGMENSDYSAHAKKISKAKRTSEVWSLNCETPDYSAMFKSRFDKNPGKADENWKTLNWEAYSDFWKRAKTVEYIGDTRKMVIGDSHAGSLYRPGWNFNSIPFKTLNGALKEMENFIPLGTEEIEFYFGNIDVRHHLCRLPGDPLANAEKLADRYIVAAKYYSASIRELLPIEDESRVLPKSGYYEGKPFWGSWKERNDVRNHFCDYIESKYGIIRWVEYLRDANGKLDFEKMEKPRSVHLAPCHWPHWQPQGSQVSKNKHDDNNLLKWFS